MIEYLKIFNKSKYPKFRPEEHVFHYRDGISKLFTYCGIFAPSGKVIKTNFNICTCQKCLKKIIKFPSYDRNKRKKLIKDMYK